jgi:glutamine amidotransferase
MCELFGLSAKNPTGAQEPLNELLRHGGLTADNPDGWGLAWWEDGAFQLAKEPLPAHQSVLFANLCGTLLSSLIIAHVRKARFPPVNTLDNTHPFQRVCCGKGWVFAHNGLVPDIVAMEQANTCPICHPSGETDSEYAFCHLLSHIAEATSNPDAGSADPFAIVAAVGELIASHGQFNFLLSDGEYLIAYGHDRLHYWEYADSAMIATEPLSGDDKWVAFALGELRVYRSGRRVGRILTRPSC